MAAAKVLKGQSNVTFIYLTVLNIHINFIVFLNGVIIVFIINGIIGFFAQHSTIPTLDLFLFDRADVLDLQTASAMASERGP